MHDTCISHVMTSNKTLCCFFLFIVATDSYIIAKIDFK